MQHFLITQTKYFFGEKGSSEEGGVEKFVSTSEIFNHIKSTSYYGSYIEYLFKDKFTSVSEILECLEDVENDDPRAYDGYVCEVYKFKVKRITEEQAKEYNEIIKQYKNI